MLIKRYNFNLNKSTHFLVDLLSAIHRHSRRSTNQEEIEDQERNAKMFSQKLEYFAAINDHEYTYF